ncbi:MAG: hypothetical protein QS2022_4590 [Candidatus Phytoplasma asteris]|uniref:Uncharacterized protein n=3 Tax=Candidatus Phytoplasma TaxID=33926 RepID=A0ABQ0J3I8_9MOLU|nr:hypothetical protein ['Chrysanthemum coronarium' phytoplasma]TKA87910.1 MAG: hypothetical protein PLY_4540 [Periwinkle leaf yellowing phytoplasma]WEX19703.1 MAG: hypothetical protein QS2022_4590 [Candidatus Phytoplasma asteris]GAK74134.1 uncharacterized protein OYV_06220 ['Chrysanthemum coronarium' phytoplasma]
MEQIYIWVQKLNTDVNSILTSFEILTAKTLKFREVSKEYDNVLDKITNIFSYMKSISTLNDVIYEQDSKSSVSDESSNLDAKVQEALDQLGGINKLKDQKVHVDQLNTQFNILKDQNPLTPSGGSGSSDTSQNNNSNVTNSFLFFFFVIFILLFVVLILYFIFQNFANTK